MAGIRQVQLTELDLGLGVVLPPGTSVCKPSSVHMAENCSCPVVFFFFLYWCALAIRQASSDQCLLEDLCTAICCRVKVFQVQDLLLPGC